MADNFRFAQLQPFSLYGAGASLGDTSITLSSMTDIDGNALSMSTDFGAIGFGTLDPGNGALEEQISFTGLVNNSNGTVTLTGVSTVLFTYPYTRTSGLAKTHAGATPFVISNTSGFYDEMTSKADDETITGTWTFTNPAYPRMDTGTPLPTDQEQLATKAYVDSVAISGAPDATTSVQGLVQLPTQAQVDAGTATGSTGASLTPTPALLRSKLLSDYVADTGAADAYVITPSPAISAYTTGQIFSFKAAHTNTTASTLNVNAKGATAIKKVDGTTALAAGDIVAGQIIQVEYDGTNFQMINPVGNAPATKTYVDATFQRFGGTGADGALAISSGTTTIDCANAAVVVKNYSSISITGTGVLAFSNPNTNGTIVILKSVGDVTLTSSATPMIDLRVMGAQASGNNGATTVLPYLASGGAAGADNSGDTGGAGGTGVAGVNSNSPSVVTTATAQAGVYMLACGGAGGIGGAGGGTGGAGGAGGGALLIECRGALNFTTASGISVAGTTGSVGTSAGQGAGGGGGGAGGTALIVYNTLTAASGTISVSGGTGGTGATGGSASPGTGGAGGNGASGAGTGGNGGNGGNTSGSSTAGGGGGAGGSYLFGTTVGSNGVAGGNTGTNNQGPGGGGGGGASGYALVVQNKNRI